MIAQTNSMDHPVTVPFEYFGPFQFPYSKENPLRTQSIRSRNLLSVAARPAIYSLLNARVQCRGLYVGRASHDVGVHEA